MSSLGSVSMWIDQLKEGDDEASRRIWKRYFRQLIGFARAKLKKFPRRVADEEDVVVSVLDKLCRCAQEGKLPYVDDRDDLWRLLLVMTSRKVVSLLRREHAGKRGGGRSPLSEEEDLARIGCREPAPEVVAEMVESWERLLNRLGDDEMRTIAVYKMEGYSNDEIAELIGRVPRTVERRLQRIRALLSREELT
jgi:RNA polymerase sigma factor (sigma-70 family)